MEKDKTEYVGVITRSSKDYIWLEVDGEIKQLAESKIKSIEHYDYDGKYFELDRNNSRHVLMPTAMNLKEGQIYYQNLLIVGNLFNVGITDNFSLAGGVFLPNVFDTELFLYVAPKLSTGVGEYVNIGTGVIAAGLLDVDWFEIEELLLVPFVNTTLGNRDRNVTFGIGYGTEDVDLENRVAAMMLGLNIRFSKILCFVTENTVAVNTRRFGGNESKDEFYIGAQAFRVIKRKNTFDLGVMILSNGTGPNVAPFLGYVRFF